MNRNIGNLRMIFPNNYCLIDIETTGLDPQIDEIIELSAIRIRNNIITDTFEQLIKPSEPIDSFITNLTGITNEMVAHMPSINDVLPSFIDFIGNDLIVGHNVRFDINFIYDTCANIGKPEFKNDYCDTMRIARKVLSELKHHRLKDLVQYYGILNKNAHRALSDCTATFEVLYKLRESAEARHIDISKVKNYKTVKSSDLSPATNLFDESHPLFEKTCVFTGALEHMTRREAMQSVLDLGGFCGDSVTKKTDFLILGSLEYCAGVKGKKSAKLKKAEDLILNGQDLTILSESAFYDLLPNPSSETNMSKKKQQDNLFDIVVTLIQSVIDNNALAKEIIIKTENKNNSISYWLKEPTSSKKTKMLLKVYETQRYGNQNTTVISVKTSLANQVDMPLDVHVSSKSNNVNTELELFDFGMGIHYVIQQLIDLFVKGYEPAEKFGCCHRYKECSDAKKCTHPDQFYARACWYRKNLESGKIFY